MHSNYLFSNIYQKMRGVIYRKKNLNLFKKQQQNKTLIV